MEGAACACVSFHALVVRAGGSSLRDGGASGSDGSGLLDATAASAGRDVAALVRSG